MSTAHFWLDWQRVALLACLLTWGSVCSAHAQLKTARSAIPALEAQEQAKQQAAEIFSKEIASATTSEQQSALAQQLLQHASELQPSAEHFVLLEMARGQAVRACDVPLALRVSELMTERYQLPLLESRMTTLRAVGEVAESDAQREQLLGAALSLASSARAEEQFDIARQAAELACEHLPRSGNAELRQRTLQVHAELVKIADEGARLASFRATLERAPADPQANLAVGRFHCFLLGDWEFGIPMLALGANERLRDVSRLELHDPQAAPQQVALGHAWWNLAQADDSTADALDVDPERLRERARTWYQRALPGLRGLSRAVAEKRIASSQANAARN